MMKIDAYAKVNLTLEVLGKRADGYHALRSLVVPVSLCDTIELSDAEDIFSDTGYDDDLCVKAARALIDGECNHCVRGVSIKVKKRIPAGGGLGGGSADAAAVLVALNEMWGLNLSPERLANIGATVGSDVPALVYSRFVGPVLMEGRGEIVSRFDTFMPPMHLVLANPGVFCPTPQVFKNCISRVTDCGSILYNIRNSFVSGDVEKIAGSLMNDLEKPAIDLHPEIGEVKKLLSNLGVLGSTMSGSGSTVFGIVPSECEGHKIVDSLRKRGISAWCVETCCPVV